MSKHLFLEPDKELEFRRPFTSIVKQTLLVSNYHPESPIAFKVKTTAPKQYCVRPNSGKLLPGESCQIQVLLQGMKEDPPLDFKCKDKFLVQSLKIPLDVFKLEGDVLTNRIQELWSQAEMIKKNVPDGASEIIAEKKLRCVYLPAADDAVIEQEKDLLYRNITNRSEFTDANASFASGRTSIPSGVSAPVPTEFPGIIFLF